MSYFKTFAKFAGRQNIQILRKSIEKAIGIKIYGDLSISEIIRALEGYEMSLDKVASNKSWLEVSAHTPDDSESVDDYFANEKLYFRAQLADYGVTEDMIISISNGDEGGYDVAYATKEDRTKDSNSINRRTVQYRTIYDSRIEIVQEFDAAIERVTKACKR